MKEDAMKKIVSILMDSPLYFTMNLKERLELVKLIFSEWADNHTASQTK